MEQATPDQSFGWQVVGLGKAQNNALEHGCLAAFVILSLFVLEWLSQIVRAGVLCSTACAHWPATVAHGRESQAG
jgi:hypothetical protein